MVRNGGPTTTFALTLALTGGLLYLLLFDRAGPQLVYLAVLLSSFVFLIGPSFHSILSAIVTLLHSARR